MLPSDVAAELKSASVAWRAGGGRLGCSRDSVTARLDRVVSRNVERQNYRIADSGAESW